MTKFTEFWSKCPNIFNKTEKPVPRPASRDQVIDWFRTTQKPKKVGFDEEGNVCQWFHGKKFNFFLNNFNKIIKIICEYN